MIDGETRMTESSGICHYLGTKHGPTPLVVGLGRAGLWRLPELDVFQRRHADLSANAGAPLQPARARRAAQSAGRRRLRQMVPRTGCGPSRPPPPVPRRLCAGRFTAADIAIGYALRLADNIGLSKDFGPNVAAYWAAPAAARRLQARRRRRTLAGERAEGGAPRSVIEMPFRDRTTRPPMNPHHSRMLCFAP